MKKITCMYKNNDKNVKVEIVFDSSLVGMTFTSQSHRVIKHTPSKSFVGELKGIDKNGNETDRFTPIATVTSNDNTYDLDIIYDKEDEELYVIPSLNGIENNTAIAVEGYAVTLNPQGEKELYGSYDGAKITLVDSATNCNLALINISGLGRGMPSNFGNSVDEGYMEFVRDDVKQYIIFGTYKSVSGDAFSKNFTAVAPTQITAGNFCLKPVVRGDYNMLAIPIP